MKKIILKGITWGHSRGFTPLAAYGQRFGELHADIEVRWDKRTLQQFADFPVEKLAEEYDLLIIDHPWVGRAAATNCVLPLEKFLPRDFISDQLRNSVGCSHRSYQYDGHQWALAIDAAVPAASYRADLFEKAGRKIPASWNDVLQLAKENKVAVPAVPIDLLMNFYTFCLALGAEPFMSNAELVDEKIAVAALETMKQLYDLVDPKMFDYNPIAVAEAMTATDKYWYCPFAYCYSNYSRTGFAKNTLTYGDLVVFNNGRRLRGTIGGTGIAVSAFSQHAAEAIRFAKEVTSPVCQATFYAEHGGQPGHKAGWTSEPANLLCHNFFKNVLPAMDNGYLRPRYNGYLFFQDNAGKPLQEYFKGHETAGDVLDEMNDIYRKSLHANLVVSHE